MWRFALRQTPRVAREGELLQSRRQIVEGAVGAVDPVQAGHRAPRAAARVEGPNGQASWFLTSFPKSELSTSAIAEAYRMRWEAEELFKQLEPVHVTLPVDPDLQGLLHKAERRRCGARWMPAGRGVDFALDR